MAYIYLEGKTQSNDQSPSTRYKYGLEITNRRANQVHVKLSVSVRMELPTNFFSFRIAHECRVMAWPVGSGGAYAPEARALDACRKSGTYQYADIKKTRAFWGHQWVGSYDGPGDFGWTYGSADYYGDAWHGPFVVFDKDVPCEVGTTKLVIIPCITQPPITGLGGSGIYAVNRQDVNNWRGSPGYWRPFGVKLDGVAGYEDIGSHSTANLGPMMTEDGSFLSNKNVEMLDPRLSVISKYPVPEKPSSLMVTPSAIDVAEGTTTDVHPMWTDSPRAARYRIDLTVTKVNLSGSQLYVKTKTWGFTSTKSGNGPYISVSKMFGISEFFDGDKVRVSVIPYDSNGVQGTPAESADVSYFARPAKAPQFARIVGRQGVDNAIAWNGEEAATLTFGGWQDGSYPIVAFTLVVLGFDASGGRDISKDVTIGTFGIDSVTMLSGYATVAGEVSLRVQALRRIGNVVMELRAIDSKGRYVYYSSSQQGYRWNVSVSGGLVSVYDGSSWKEGVVNVWNGSSWVVADRVHVFDGSGEWAVSHV
jgi:hypothetical protein